MNDIKYAYYNTTKGYRVVGGTAAHFLKADGSVDNTVYTSQNYVSNNFIPKSHPVYNVTQANINNWNTAFGWGDFRNFGLGTNNTSLTNYPNLNNIPMTSFFEVDGTNVNRPVGANYGAGVSIKKGGSEYVQLMVDVISGALYTRGNTTSANTGWIRSWNSKNFNPDGKINNLENATGVGFVLGSVTEPPYVRHSSGTSVFLATKNWTIDNYVAKSSLTKDVVIEGAEVRLNPLEFRLTFPIDYIDIEDPNRLIHVINKSEKATINIKGLFPKQQYVIYNLDPTYNDLTILIQDTPVFYLVGGKCLRMYVTENLEVINEDPQPCSIIW